MRLDKYLTKNNLVSSRNKAQELIQNNSVYINDICINKNNHDVKEEDIVEVKDSLEFVSRSGHKLKQALTEFDISVADAICLDIGSSTGGFTDCLLQNNAKLVYAVDVGKDQLDQGLKQNPKVISVEDTDIRDFLKEFKSDFDFICVDVSFISLKYILPSIQNRFLSDLVLLYKPEFEVGKENLKHGIVKSEKITTQYLKDFEKFVDFLKLKVVKIIKSNTIGKHGNQEYLIHIRKS